MGIDVFSPLHHSQRDVQSAIELVTASIAPNMSSARLIRPFARAFARPSVFSSSKAAVAPFTPSFNAQFQKKNNAVVPVEKMRILQAMPQLIPFYFVNEVTTAFIIMPTLIYIFSKYLLPQRVRTMCARLFISKL